MRGTGAAHRIHLDLKNFSGVRDTVPRSHAASRPGACPRYVRTAVVTGVGRGAGAAIARQLASAGVSVLVASVVNVASVKTLSDRNPQRRRIDPEEAAAAAIYLCSDAARGIDGEALVIDGGELRR